MKKIFITGTDTDVGKTIVSVGLCLTWPAHYWKPIQAGYHYKEDEKSLPPPGASYRTTHSTLKYKKTNKANLKIPILPKINKENETLSDLKENNHILPKTDNEVLSQFIPVKNIYPSAYTLKNPLSPNQAGNIENIYINSQNITLPKGPTRLVIEGAGGALVPFNDKEDMTNLMKKWDCPVIVVARSGLGTLNHTFLTLSALKVKKISVMGVIMVGPPHPLNKKDISAKAPVLLELPFLQTLSSETLISYFKKINLQI